MCRAAHTQLNKLGQSGTMGDKGKTPRILWRLGGLGMVPTRVTTEVTFVAGRGAGARPGSTRGRVGRANDCNGEFVQGGVWGGVNETNSPCYLKLPPLEPCRGLARSRCVSGCWILLSGTRESPPRLAD